MENKLIKSIIVLLSGNGSTFQAIHDNCTNIEISRVYSNNYNAYGITRAGILDIPCTISSVWLESSIIYDLSNHYTHVKLIVLAGYMRILSPGFIQFCQSNNIDIVNIHPSLLPKYKGLHTHKRVLEAKDSHHGISIHYVNKDLDGGPIIFQRSFPVLEDDTEDTLTVEVKKLEQLWYPKIIDVLANNENVMEQLY